MAVDGVEETHQPHLTATGSDDADDTDVLYADGRGDYIEIGVAQLMPRQTVGCFLVVFLKSLHVAECLAAECVEYPQVVDQRYFLYLGLVDSRNTFVKGIERTCLQLVVERVAV